MTILYADDDQDDREFFLEVIEAIDPGGECIVKHNGMDALQWLNEATTPPDYIFLDINMPVMDGKECLVEIRKNPRLKEIPVIIYSTASEPREIATLYFLGASSYITKPRSYNELMPVLLSFFEKSDSSKHCIESQ